MKLPVLYTTVEVPECFCTAETVKGNQVIYGGDIRIGDLRNLGRPDFLVYRSVGKAHDEGGMKPCFIGAFYAAGSPLWSAGTAGTQPCRPGPVAVHDIDRDGRTEIICFFLDGTVEAEAGSMEDVVIQVRDGATGSIKNQAAPEAFLSCRGYGPNWAHQRILIANFRGMDTPGDFVVKL